MRQIILTVSTILNVSIALGSSLPKACEDLAWKYASVQVEAEGYADIVNVGFNQTSNEYLALVRPNETSNFQMKFRYNESSNNQCLLLNLEAFYR